MNRDKEFRRLLKKFSKQPKFGPTLKTVASVEAEDIPIEFWVAIYGDSSLERHGISITQLEKTLLTTYRQEFIAWLRLQQ